MFRIGDFSKLGQVSTRMLRHYDKLGLLVPEQTDEWTGYRYYTIHQLPRLHRIIALKDLGLSLQQIADLLGEDDSLPNDQLRGMLTLKQSELAREKAEMEFRLAQVEARLEQLEHSEEPSPYEILVKSVPSLPVASLKQIVPHVQEMGYYCETMTRSLYRKLSAGKVGWGEPELTLYHTSEYRENDVEIEVCIGLDQEMSRPALVDEDVTFRVLPERPLVAALMYEGPFSGLTPAIFELIRWVGTHQHVPAGPLRELHLSGPAHPETPTDAVPVVELQLPIEQIGSSQN